MANEAALALAMRWLTAEASYSPLRISLTSSYSRENTDELLAVYNATIFLYAVTITPEDDECGESLVYYKDPTSGEGTSYDTGLIRFWINQPSQ
jgi:hypothetical protein